MLEKELVKVSDCFKTHLVGRTNIYEGRNDVLDKVICGGNILNGLTFSWQLETPLRPANLIRSRTSTKFCKARSPAFLFFFN